VTPAGSPLDVLRDHEHQATTGAEGTAYCARCEAVADVKELVEAARRVMEAQEDGAFDWVGTEDAPDVLSNLEDALARFDRNQQA
jgi:hypothetical protein